MRYALLLVLLALLVSTHTVFAQETTPSSPSARQEIMQERKALLKEAKIASGEARATLKETFKQRLAAFRDKVKAERVLRINTILSGVNDKRTSTMLEHLEKMSEIVTKLETHIATLQKEGKDTAAAIQTVADAKTAIDSAKTAVEAQTAKDYTIALTSESTAKTDAATARQTLHTDLQAVHDTVVAARKKVSEAIATTRSLVGDTNNGE